MNKDEMHVVIDMDAYRSASGISKRELARRVNKEESVVVKQISEKKRTNMQLFSAYEYAEALGGGVKFLTDAQIDELPHMEENKKKAAEVDKLREENAELNAQVKRLIVRLDTKDDAIMRKDAMLNRLLHQKEAMTKVLHEHGIDLKFLDEVK